MSTTFDPSGSQPLPGSSNNALAVGSVVGDFTIQGLVGEGGFGIVYRAFDNVMQREVAVKEYMPNALARRRPDGGVELRAQQYEETFNAGRKSFVNEAKLLAQFDHKALVKVLRFFEANGTAYMVMPLYHGRTLKQILRESPKVDEAWIKAMLAPLLDALETLHGARCFHRDVAPDNILILDSGPLLLDLGAARRIIGDMTQAVTVVIKPGYAPVEQYADDNSLQQGPWTDIYALAAVVRLAITGKPPATSVTRMVSDPVRPLTETVTGYSAQFLHAVDYGLAVRPEDRPQSIAEFRQALGLDKAPSRPVAAAAQPPAPAAAPAPTAPAAAPPLFATQRVATPAPAATPAPPPSATQRVSAPPAATPTPPLFATQRVAAPPPRDLGQTDSMAAVNQTVPMRSSSEPPPAASIPMPPRPVTRPPPAAAPQPARRQWLPIAIVAAMMIVVVGAGYFVMQAVTSPPQRDNVARAPAASSGTVATPAAPVSPPVEAKAPPVVPPAPSTPPPAAAPAPQAAPPPPAEPRPQPVPEPAPPPAAKPAEPVAAAPPPAPAAPPPPTGRVMLDIRPWGEVFVDGRNRGLSPPIKVLPLPEGPHRIEIRNPAGAAFVRDVKVTAGGRIEIGHTFK